jgi:hypothetical protein
MYTFVRNNKERFFWMEEPLLFERVSLILLKVFLTSLMVYPAHPSWLFFSLHGKFQSGLPGWKF